MNEIIAQIKSSLFDSVTPITESFFSGFTKFIGGLVLFIIVWIVIKIIRKIVQKALQTIQFDKAAEKLNADVYLEKANISLQPSQIIVKVVNAVMMLFLALIMMDYVGFVEGKGMIMEFIYYLPKLALAVIILGLGLWLGNVAKDVVKAATSSIGGSSSNILGSLVFYAIVIMTSLIALEKAGIKTSIIETNLSLILGSILFAFSLAYGLGGRHTMRNMVAGFYNKKKFSIGNTIVIDGEEGKVIDMDSISVTIQTEKGKLIIPAKDLTESKVMVR